MSDKDGGRAFPSMNELNFGHFGTKGHAGMTLRDYFAAKALPLLGGSMLTAMRKEGEKRGITLPQAVARAAYNYADAMLNERNRER